MVIGCIAPTGIAASNLPEGRTIHNFCGIPVSHNSDMCLEKPTTTTLNNLRDRAQMSTLALLLIVEISNVGSRLFGHNNTIMQQIMENEDFFGGLAVITMGDFFQLPPVRPAETLYSAVLSLQNEKVSLHPEKPTTGPRNSGINLFKTSTKIELTEQMRAADDSKHAEFLNQLRTTSRTGTAISKQSLGILKTLTKEDVEKNDSWTRATTVVTSNEERLRINDYQSKVLSKKNCPTILWNKPTNGIVANSLTLDNTNYIYNNYTQFTGVFVKGAPAYLQDNINPRRGLSNGTPVTLHSLVLHPDEDPHRVLEELTQSNAVDARLQYNPLYVLVKLPQAHPEDLIGLSVEENEAVIPLTMNSESKAYTINLPFRKSMVLKTKKIHGYELGFAITFHKIQGQTCDKIIVDLKKRPFQPQVSFATFYVAISRVQRSLDLRLLPLHQGEKNLNHLLSLKSPKELNRWLAGFNPTNGLWEVERIELYDNNEPIQKKK